MFKFYFAVLSKGQVMSQYYRVMNKNGGWTWIQSCATVVCSTKNSDEQNIICVNYVLRLVKFSNSKSRSFLEIRFLNMNFLDYAVVLKIHISSWIVANWNRTVHPQSSEKLLMIGTEKLRIETPQVGR